MKKENFKCIQQCEATKDVIWFLKGAISTNDDFPLSRVHIESLTELVNYVYDSERQKEGNKINETI